MRILRCFFFFIIKNTRVNYLCKFRVNSKNKSNLKNSLGFTKAETF